MDANDHNPTVSPVSLTEFTPIASSGRRLPITALSGIDLEVSVIAGTAKLPLQRAATLAVGDLIPLDRGPEDTVDIMVNGVHTARGDVIVLDDHIAARVAEFDEPQHHDS